MYSNAGNWVVISGALATLFGCRLLERPMASGGLKPALGVGLAHLGDVLRRPGRRDKNGQGLQVDCQHRKDQQWSWGQYVIDGGCISVDTIATHPGCGIVSALCRAGWQGIRGWRQLINCLSKCQHLPACRTARAVGSQPHVRQFVVRFCCWRCCYSHMGQQSRASPTPWHRS